MERKLGVWIVGACGGVATCAVAGAEAVRKGVVGASGLVSEAALFFLTPTPAYRYSFWMMLGTTIGAIALVARRAQIR